MSGQAMDPRPHCLLSCCRCGRTYEKHRLACEDCPQALLRSVYAQKQLLVREAAGLFRFGCWLPSEKGLDTPIGPVVYGAEAYGREIGLPGLQVAFNGYWPERGARNVTGSFKDLEAMPTLAYFREQGITSLVLASVGNTARAFAYACSEQNFPCVIIVPEKMFHRLWLPCAPAPCVRTLVLRGSSNYYAAIVLGEKLRARFNVMTEGGARNVARRDGMGTTVLEYARVFGKMPAHYVQAVGSGTGGIAAYEAALRLREDGRFGGTLPRLHLVQNAPFAPMHEAWSAGRDHDPQSEPVERQMERVRSMYADVLANTHPPYGVVGGVRDALRETDGATYAVTREEAQREAESFQRLEGVSINEPAACAAAGLRQALQRGAIRSGEAVLLNVTGGGMERIQRDFRIQTLEPTRIVEDGRFDLETLDSYEALFR